MARAVATEPGTTYRTLVGSEDVTQLEAPQAQAIYPGGDPTESDDTLGQETATVTPTTADASSTSEDGATASEHMAADLTAQTLDATASVSSGDITVAGVLLIHSVTGQASITHRGGVDTPTASVSPVSATVAGIPISIDTSGVHGVTDQVSAALSAAGISFSVLDPVTSTTADGAVADSGGIVVRVAQKDTGLLGAAGLSTGFDVSLLLGKVTVTESHAVALSFPGGDDGQSAAPTSPAGSSPTAAAAVPSSAPTTTPTRPVGVAEPPALSAPDTQAAAAPAPQVASPLTQPASQVRVLGHRVRVQAVLAGLGAWQLLTLGTAIGAVLLSRGDADEEEHLCPC
jgi:hypothetical protein